ncbi:MAG: hypothetical protein IT370_37910 [Deltaproteobacteria bacterium]|nr:hypothetical protein [Deltaproteobacteria bacterium]
MTMRVKLVATAMATVLLLGAGALAGCNKSEKAKRKMARMAGGPGSEELRPRGGAVVQIPAPSVIGVPEAPTVMGVAGASALDLGTPEKTLTAVFDAARTGDTHNLLSLCAADGDGDVKQICAMTAQHPEWAEFAKVFKDGKITAPAAIVGNEATVEFSFGEGGTEHETMQFTNVDGKWLLSGF